MIKNILYLFMAFLLFACAENDDEQKPKTLDDTELIVEEDGMHTEYYPGKKQIKIQGPMNDKGERNGKWVYFSEDGRQLNFTMYMDGKKHGHSYNAYSNGAPFYYGEYWNDTMIGEWKTYDSKGKVTTKDYGIPEGY